MIKENILTSTVLNTDVVWGTVKYWILNTIWIHHTFLTTTAPSYNSSWNENINVRNKKKLLKEYPFPQNNNNKKKKVKQCYAFMTIQQFLFYNKTIASLNTLSTNFHFIESKMNQHLVKNKKLLKDTFSSWFSMIDKPQQTLHSVSSVLQIPFPEEISTHSFISIAFTAIIVATYTKLKESRGNSSFASTYLEVSEPKIFPNLH